MTKVLNSLGNGGIVELLLNGGVGVIPTDTLYGLVCCATNKNAVARLYGLKSRQSKPGTVIAATAEQLIELGLKARYLKPVSSYWPNPISIIIPNFELEYIHLGTGGIAVRIPDKAELTLLLERTGPLLTTSANHPNEPEAVNVEQAVEYFGDQVDFYADGGDLSDRKPSTLIRIVDDAIEVLREGAVIIDQAGRIGHDIK